MNRKISARNVVIIGVIVLLLIPVSYISYKLYDYKIFIWLPTYLTESTKNDIRNTRDGHVIFLFVDHHEPGHGERGVKISNEWCERFRKNIAGVTDDYGNPFQYTWFYPFDHHNPQVVFNLNALVFEGLGEVEFHWHHGNDTNQTFPTKLKEAVDWFTSFGCFQHVGADSKPRFGFIHGNWALDNSLNMPSRCGVNRELDILKEYGCYADFTFSTLGTIAQPSKVNSIYYAKDTDGPKSYATGVDARVGHANSDFMIFEGPICVDWHDRIFECAAFESTSPFKPHRVELWLKNAPKVKGRPNWIFIKVYTHGAQSRNAILSSQFNEMCSNMKDICHRNRLKLHYVTAREAFNMVKAAEHGLSGDPEQYRDYVLKKPINRQMLVTSRIKNASFKEEHVRFDLVQPEETALLFKTGPVIKLKGWISSYNLVNGLKGSELSMHGKGVMEVVSNKRIQFGNKIKSEQKKNDGSYFYSVDALPSGG